MGIGHFGERLAKMRKNRAYQTVNDCVTAMNKFGFQITTNQFYELEKGQWPTRMQLVMLCDFFDVSYGFLLLGDEFETLNNLTKEQQAIIIALINQFSEFNKKLSSTKT